MMRVFAASGITSCFQILKNALRWRLLGETRPCEIPAGEVVLLKETLGPFTLAEATYDPAAILLEAGLPPDKLHIIFLLRDPSQTWLSWQSWWNERTDMDLFSRSYETFEEIKRSSDWLKIASTRFHYDVFLHHSPQEVFRMLFRRLRVECSSPASGGWRNELPYGEHGSNIVHPEEPVEFVTPRIHDEVIASGSFKHMPRDVGREPGRTPGSQTLSDARVVAICEEWLEACMIDLGLDSNPA